MRRTKDEDFACRDCGAMYHRSYMVHDRVWIGEAGLPPVCLLCMSCLETVLGRKLVPADFTLAPTNWWSYFGDPLRPVPSDDEIERDAEWPYFHKQWKAWARETRRVTHAAGRLYEEMCDLRGHGIAHVAECVVACRKRAKTTVAKEILRGLECLYWSFLAAGPYRDLGEAYI